MTALERYAQVLRVPGAPLELRWALLPNHNYAFTSTALTGQLVLIYQQEDGTWATKNIAEIGAVRSVVPSPQLQDAFATEQARMSSVYLAGPPLGGALFGLARSLPFLVDAISYAFSTGTLLAMRTPFQEERGLDDVLLSLIASKGIRSHPSNSLVNL